MFAWISGVLADLRVLRSIWFKQLSGDTHAERLDNFYKNQADAYDRFRKNFLHGREPLVEQVAAEIRKRDAEAGDNRDVVWVDLGGGTAENVDMMSKYIGLDRFKKIYVVDLCSSLCKIAIDKVAKKGWTNVTVVEEDACVFSLPDGEDDDDDGHDAVRTTRATKAKKKSSSSSSSKSSNPMVVVTFSYSLSMIPPFHSAVDNAMSLLGSDGLLGIADFYVSGKFDKADRQMSTTARWFWRCTFDTDNIDIGPERRDYVDLRGEMLYELNSAGGIPYVPLLKAPYYVWVGRKKD